MANVNMIINAMQTILNAAYQNVHGRAPSSRPTAHMVAFREIQGNAAQIHAILSQNPVPSPGSRLNISMLFDNMGANVRLYCQKTDATRPVLIAFNNAHTEWELLTAELVGR